jgi:autotransporter-associated beta strand protein
MRGFSANWKAIRSFLGNVAPDSRQKPRTFRRRRATFETLTPREMLSASSGRMIAAHSLAISASSTAGQPAMVSACGHSSLTGSSAATLAAYHLVNGVRNNGAALVQLGSGALTLTGAMNYHGGTTVAGGTLTLTGTNAFTGSTTINAGTLAIWNSGITSQTGTGGISINPNPVTLSAGTVPLNGGTLRVTPTGTVALDSGTTTLAGNSL